VWRSTIAPPVIPADLRLGLDPGELACGDVDRRIGRRTAITKHELKKQVWAASPSLPKWPRKIRAFFHRLRWQDAQFA